MVPLMSVLTISQWDLYNIDPITKPAHMTLVPHLWQPKGATQGHKCSESDFKGFLLGDNIGVEETINAILMLWLVRDEPEMSLVICPASLCHKWITTIENS